MKGFAEIIQARDLDQQSYPNGLLLAYPVEGCKRLCQEVRQMPEV